MDNDHLSGQNRPSNNYTRGRIIRSDLLAAETSRQDLQNWLAWIDSNKYYRTCWTTANTWLPWARTQMSQEAALLLSISFRNYQQVRELIILNGQKQSARPSHFLLLVMLVFKELKILLLQWKSSRAAATCITFRSVLTFYYQVESMWAVAWFF